jgi:hypothetical protein
MAANSKWIKEKNNAQVLGRLLRAMSEGLRLFAKDREPTLREIKTMVGIDRDLAVRLIDGTVWYTIEQHLDPNSPVSLDNPSELQRGVGKQLAVVRDIALWGKVIDNPGDIPAYIDNRPAKFALGR